MEQTFASTLRLARPEDAPRLGQLLHDFNAEFDTATPGPEPIARRLGQLLAGDTTFAVVLGDPIVGFGIITLRTNVWFAGPVALLDELYVEPHLRGNGFGSHLITLMESTCRQRGIEQVEINVDEGDIDARRFYERLGYRSGAGGGERALYYERLLTTSTDAA
jgi:GNAT superfamily N-acetyltransferase